MDQGCEADQKTRAPPYLHVGWVGLAALLILADVLKRFQRSSHAQAMPGYNAVFMSGQETIGRNYVIISLSWLAPSHVMLQCW